MPLSDATLERYRALSNERGPNAAGYFLMLQLRLAPRPSTKNPCASWEWWDEEFGKAMGNKRQLDDVPAWLFERLAGYFDGGPEHQYKMYESCEAAELAVCAAVRTLIPAMRDRAAIS